MVASMSVTLLDMRQAIADAVSSRIPDLQVSPWMLANPTPPTAQVFPTAVNPHMSMGPGGFEEWTFTLQVFVGGVETVSQGSQIRLDEYLRGDRSITAAIEADTTLGGVVDDLKVTSISGYRVFTTQGRADVLGAEWSITVYVSD